MKREMDENTHGAPSDHMDLDRLLREMPADEAASLASAWARAEAARMPTLPTADVEHALDRFFLAAEASDEQADPARRLRRRAARPVSARPSSVRPAEDAAPRRWRQAGWGLVTAVVVAGLLAALWTARPVTHVAPPGERLTVELPDGSHVELNSGSQLEHPRRFGDVRRVRLTGEAFFEVARSDRPFIVETYNAQVRVLGTRFGVRAWPGRSAAGTIVALEEGRVALSPASMPRHATVLAAGDVRRIGPASPAAPPLPWTGSVEDALAWRQGALVFKDERLSAVLADVERRFATEVRVRPEQLGERRLNLALRDPASAEAVLRDVALALGLSYRETAEGFELFKDGPGLP